MFRDFQTLLHPIPPFVVVRFPTPLVSPRPCFWGSVTLGIRDHEDLWCTPGTASRRAIPDVRTLGPTAERVGAIFYLEDL